MGPDEGRSAVARGGQARGMEFWIAAREHHGPAGVWQGLIGEGTPGPHLQTQGGEEFQRLGIGEVEGGVLGHHHWAFGHSRPGVSPINLGPLQGEGDGVDPPQHGGARQ
ncbi:MAG: hypothetical protein ACK56I_29580, partial [bacterium]